MQAAVRSESYPLLHGAFPNLDMPPKKPDPEPVADKRPWWKEQWVGTVAQWAAFCAMLALFLVGRSCNHASEDFKLKVDERINSKLGPVDTKLGDLIQRVSKIEGKLDVLTVDQKRITRLQLNKLSAQISAAQRSKTKIDPQVIAVMAKDVVSLSSSNDPVISDLAWKLANQLLTYRSFLAVSQAPKISLTKPVRAPFHFEVNARRLPGYPLAGTLVKAEFSGKPVPMSQAARFERIGHNDAFSVGPSYYIVNAGEGTEITLDGFHLKNVILRNATIVYRGGPLILENVYFVNCRFNISKTDAGIEFADNVVSSVPINFKPS